MAPQFARCRARGVSIGKLHYRDAEDDDGFSQNIRPIYVVEGQGDVLGLLRKDARPRQTARAMAGKAGSGPSGYSDFDNNVADAAVSCSSGRLLGIDALL